MSLEDVKAMMADKNNMHKFFVHCRGEFSAENFCCFYLIEIYKINPRKRMADFLIKYYMKQRDEPDDEYGQFTTPLNITPESGSGMHERNLKQKIVEKRISYALIGSNFAEKRKRHGFFGAIQMKARGSTKSAPDLFDDLQKNVAANVANDMFRRFSSRPIGQAADGGAPLIRFRQALTAAGWSPDDLGMWD